MNKPGKSIISRRPLCTFWGLLAITALTVTLLAKEVVAAEVLPIEGTYGVTFTLTPTAPNTFLVVATGIGRTLHLGNSSVGDLGNSFLDITKTANANATPPSLEGTFKLTFENGDTLSGTISGVFTFPPDSSGFGAFSGQFTFTAGTGQLQGASGTASFTGLANFAKNQALYSFQGNVSIPGSLGN